MFLERRSSVRVSCELPSTFRDVGNTKDSSSRFATVKDISRGGLRLHVSEFVPLTNKLILSLSLPKHKAVEVGIAPAWISEIPATGKYEVGARFVEISEEAKIAIQNFQLQALAS